jgi:membrane-bound lytic murein transglycosylase B
VQAQLPPEAYAALYRAAARTCPGMPWTLLAAVGQVESGHGRNNGPSSAGAVGPMQFMPRTFAAYAVDGDGDGVASPWSPPDAVFTAARYLCVNGGGSPATVRQALFAYNRAQWYVDLVLAVQARIDATV